MKKQTWGGRRPGAGRKTAEEKGLEKRIQTPLTVLPSVLSIFKMKHGRRWSRRVEELMREDQ